MNSSSKEIVLSRDTKELFVLRFMKVLIKVQNTWRYEIKEGTAADFTVGTVVGLSVKNTCVAVYFLKSCKPLDLQLY